MQALIQSLPDRTGADVQGWLVVFNSNDAAEGNVMTTDQVNLAWEKNWGAAYVNSDDDERFYDGVALGIESIENAQGTMHNYYTLDGRKVVNPTKGVYIVNGHKVVIK